MHPATSRLCFVLFVILLFPCTACSKSTTPPQQTRPDLEIMIGQMLMVGFRGTTIDATSPIAKDIKDGHLGAVLLFDYDVALHQPQRNITSPKQLKKLVTALKSYAQIPLLIAIDQEGGKVARLKEKQGFPPTVSAAALGKDNSPEHTRKAGERTGSILAEMGITMDLAPVVDVNTNPECPAIGKLERSFSADPAIVATQAEAFIEGLHAKGILSCLKHFPGHGSSLGDSHKGVTDVSATWSPIELLPYKMLIAQDSCDAIMTAHIFNSHLDPEHPATLSPKILTELLRKQMGYTGVILTDDMQMGAITKHYGFDNAITRAILAGADILVFGNNLHYDPDVANKAIAVIKRMVAAGTIPRSRIKASFDRILQLKSKFHPDADAQHS